MARLTPENLVTAQAIIARYPPPVGPGAAVPPAQEQDGYLAEDAMQHVAELLNTTPAEVYGTASFYEMFKLHPVGTYLIGVCTNISCMLNGAYELVEHAEKKLGLKIGGTTPDGLITLEEMECLAACTIAPCLQVNYRYEGNVTTADFDSLVDSLRAGTKQGVPPHGTLATVRQRPTDRWADSGRQELHAP